MVWKIDKDKLEEFYKKFPPLEIEISSPKYINYPCQWVNGVPYIDPKDLEFCEKYSNVNLFDILPSNMVKTDDLL